MRMKFLMLTNTLLLVLASNHKYQEEITENQKGELIVAKNEDNLRHHRFNNSDSRIPKRRGKEDSRKNSSSDDGERNLNLSKNGERIDFQIQNHKGPKSYIFGFDTGHGKNRQYRLEERLKDGTVKGQYGYYDARGKLRRVRYFVRPFDGYEETSMQSNGRRPES